VEALPKLRPDLIHSTYMGSDGKEDVVLSDPVGVKYYRMSKYELEYLKALDGKVSPDGAIEKLRREGRYYTQDDAKMILGKATQAGLLLGTQYGTSERQMQFKKSLDQAKKLKSFSSLFYLYLPLFNPDRFLDKTLWVFRLLVNRWTGCLFLLAVPGAAYMIVDGLARMRTEYLFFFNVTNGIYLSFAIAATKVIHEFSHAYTAKSFGLRIPVLGVGFILFFPVMYCDTTDAWTLADRKQRMAISAAGIMAEMVMAVVGLYIWYFTKPGVVNSIAFYQMSYSLVSTIVFNGNPLIKFDGYFVLMDLVRKPNLAAKAQGQVKYLWMNRFLGLKNWKKTAATPNETVFFTLYGATSFVYRLSVIFGIIIGIYSRFDKTLGIALALVAICLNVGLPVKRGLSTVVRNRGSIRPRLLGSVVVIVLAVVGLRLTFTPWSSKTVLPCYVDSAHSQKLTIPLLTNVAQVLVKEGSPAVKGQVLIRLDASEVQLSLIQKQLDRDTLRAEVEMLLLDKNEKDRAAAPSKEIEVRKKEQEITKTKRDLEIALKGVTAPFDGVVTQLDAKLEPGYRPGEGAVVGEFKSVDVAVVHSLIPEWAVDRVARGQSVIIWFPLKTGITLSGSIQTIRAYGERDLANTPFTSAVGGELATEEVQVDKGFQPAERIQAPLEAQYVATYRFDNRELHIPLGMVGRLVVPWPPRSLITRMYDHVLQAFYRESLF
jgi:putative peptide zinc metalloprotease protein